MNRILALIAVIAVLFIASCTADKDNNPTPTTTDACAYDTSQLKYNGFIKTIINTSCANSDACHSSGGTFPFTSYALVDEKFTGGQLSNRLLVVKDMPQGTSLSTCDFKKMQDWINANCPE